MKRQKMIKTVFAILILTIFGGLFSQPASAGPKKFQAQDSCYLWKSQGEYFAIKVSGHVRGNYVYINKMEYKLKANPTSGKSQFRLNVPDAKILPKNRTKDINWWGERRRDNWWNKSSWTTFWKSSNKNSKMAIAGTVWSGKFRADISYAPDDECEFKINL